MLAELCRHAGLEVEQISYCSGFLSQKITWLARAIFNRHHLLGWTLVMPLRILPLLLDPLIHRLTAWPDFSIGLEAYKPRFPEARGRSPSAGQP